LISEKEKPTHAEILQGGMPERQKLRYGETWQSLITKQL